MISFNGLTWNLATTNPPGNYRAIAFGDGCFVAVGNENKIIYSINGGNSWSLSTS